MKTLDEVIAELEDEGLFTDALHYLQAYKQLTGALMSDNAVMTEDGIYCKVCGSRLDKDWEDEDA